MCKRYALCLVVIVGLAWVGCVGQTPSRLKSAQIAYQREDYATALRQSQMILDHGHPELGDEAAYLAGASAYQLGQTRRAERHFRRAARSTDHDLSGQALASLGLILLEQGRHQAAAGTLINAATRLKDQPRANAYLHAAIAQQKLGWWDQARTNLSLARSGSRNAAFRERVAHRMRVEGFSLQMGAFSDDANARRAVINITATATKLRLGTPRLVKVTNHQQQRLTLVQLGNFSTYDAALAVKNQLHDQDLIIVPIER